MFPPHKFFPSVKFNLAKFILAGRRSNQVAIHFVREGIQGVEKITWAELTERTRQAYDSLVSYGVKPGDKIAVVMSNSVNSIVLCLATLAIGALWSSASPDLGFQAIIDRYGQIGAKFLFADDAYVYAGKQILLGERIAAVSQALADGRDGQRGLQNVVIVPYCGVPMDMSKIRRGISWKEFVGNGIGRALSFCPLPFNYPAFILFSSGTVR